MICLTVLPERDLSKTVLGQLFASCFLEEGSLHTNDWQESLSQPNDIHTFLDRALTLFYSVANFHSISEAFAEQELIGPILRLLGWDLYLPQQGIDHNRDIFSHLLFGDADYQDNAVIRPQGARYPDDLAFAENRRFGLTLDAREEKQTGSPPRPDPPLPRYSRHQL